MPKRYQVKKPFKLKKRHVTAIVAVVGVVLDYVIAGTGQGIPYKTIIEIIAPLIISG